MSDDDFDNMADDAARYAASLATPGEQVGYLVNYLMRERGLGFKEAEAAVLRYGQPPGAMSGPLPAPLESPGAAQPGPQVTGQPARYDDTKDYLKFCQLLDRWLMEHEPGQLSSRQPQGPGQPQAGQVQKFSKVDMDRCLEYQQRTGCSPMEARRKCVPIRYAAPPPTVGNVRAPHFDIDYCKEVAARYGAATRRIKSNWTRDGEPVYETERTSFGDYELPGDTKNKDGQDLINEIQDMARKRGVDIVYVYKGAAMWKNGQATSLADGLEKVLQRERDVREFGRS